MDYKMFRDYNGGVLIGSWYSPILYESRGSNAIEMVVEVVY